MSHPMSDMDPLTPFEAMAEPRAAATQNDIATVELPYPTTTAYSLGTTPRTGMTRLMAKICERHLSRSQLQRQRQPTAIPFVWNAQENRGHTGTRHSDLEALIIRQQQVREIVLITGDEGEVTICTADPGIYFLSARRKNVSWKPRRADVDFLSLILLEQMHNPLTEKNNAIEICA
ncbi:hypothetical protein KCU83_g470, partial [Aureobasidium melanogenum]